MRNFKEYVAKQELKNLSKFLLENNVSFNDEDLNYLIESDWWNRTKKSIGRGARTAALLSTLPATMSANWKDANPQPYAFTGERMYVNQQHDQDQESDKKYVAAGGQEFKQTLEDAQFFTNEYRHSPQHKMALQKAGLPSNYIPSVIRQFIFGEKIATNDELAQTSVTVMEQEVKRKFGRDSFVSLVSSEDVVTGGKQVLVRIEGTVVAMDQQDAERRVEVIIREIAKDKGFNVTGFRADSKETTIRSAPRSTMDFAAESTGIPVRFKVLVKFIAK